MAVPGPGVGGAESELQLQPELEFVARSNLHPHRSNGRSLPCCTTRATPFFFFFKLVSLFHLLFCPYQIYASLWGWWEVFKGLDTDSRYTPNLF